MVKNGVESFPCQADLGELPVNMETQARSPLAHFPDSLLCDFKHKKDRTYMSFQDAVVLSLVVDTALA